MSELANTYHKVSDKNKDRISLICYATVSHMFAEFCNDKFRGQNFKWEKFPEIMAIQCEMQVILVNLKGKNNEAIKEHAKNTGKEIAQDMIKLAGFLGE